MAHILRSSGKIFKTSGKVFRVGEPPNPVYDLNPANWVSQYINNDLVQTIYDSSGNGYDATQSDSAARSTFKTGILNGLPVLRFAAAHYYPLPILFSPGTIFIVASSNPISSNYGSFFGDSVTEGRSWTWSGNLSGGGIYFDFNNTVNSTNFGGGAHNKVFVNSGSGVAPNSVTRNSAFTLMTLDITNNLHLNLLGVDYRTGVGLELFYRGDIARILIFSQRLTTLDRQAITAQLMSTYAL